MEEEPVVSWGAESVPVVSWGAESLGKARVVSKGSAAEGSAGGTAIVSCASGVRMDEGNGLPVVTAAHTGPTEPSSVAGSFSRGGPSRMLYSVGDLSIKEGRGGPKSKAQYGGSQGQHRQQDCTDTNQKLICPSANR